MMAESKAISELNLPETFKEILNLYDTLETTSEPTGSDKVQGYVSKACELCKKGITMVNKLHVFSDNEVIEEVSTTEIRYMLLPALMGYFLLKNTVQERLKVVQECQEFYADYMRMCRSYNVTQHELAQPNKPGQNGNQEQITPASRDTRMPSPADLHLMANARSTKIQRFKEQKELENKLKELCDQVEKDHVDDDVKRDYYLTLLKRWVNICIDELLSIQDEIAILEMMSKRKPDTQNTEPPKKAEPKSQSYQPLRPFIITKDMLQKQVYGLGYPSLPTMTIEEFFDKQVSDGFIDPNSVSRLPPAPEEEARAQEQSEAEKEVRVEADDSGELQKARDLDEYKDDHRRGWGNRHNRH